MALFTPASNLTLVPKTKPKVETPGHQSLFESPGRPSDSPLPDYGGERQPWHCRHGPAYLATPGDKGRTQVVSDWTQRRSQSFHRQKVPVEPLVRIKR